MTQTLDPTVRSPAIQYVTTDDGYRIAYSVTGEGEPFLFTPCLVQNDILRDHPDTADFVRALEARFRLVRYDGRGTGNSTRGLSPNTTIEDTARDMLAVIRELDLDRFILYGDVFNSYPAFLVAAQLGSAVRALVLVCPQDFTGEPLMAGWEAMYTTSWEMFTNTFATALAGPGWSGREMREVVNHEDFLRLARSACGHVLTDVLARVKTPTLILCQREPTFPSTHATARMIASAIPGAEFVILDGQRIYDLLRNSAAGLPPVVPVIEEFLARLAGPRPGRSNEDAIGRLSGRELEVLRLLAAGRSNQQIADALVISPNTVAKHVSSILSKTESANRTEAAMYAQRRGLV